MAEQNNKAMITKVRTAFLSYVAILCFVHTRIYYIMRAEYCSISHFTSFCFLVLCAQSLRKKQQNATNAVQMPPPRYFEVLSLIEQSPLSQEGHVQLQRAIQK